MGWVDGRKWWMEEVVGELMARNWSGLMVHDCGGEENMQLIITNGWL